MQSSVQLHRPIHSSNLCPCCRDAPVRCGLTLDIIYQQCVFYCCEIETGLRCMFYRAPCFLLHPCALRSKHPRLQRGAVVSCQCTHNQIFNARDEYRRGAKRRRGGNMKNTIRRRKRRVGKLWTCARWKTTRNKDRGFSVWAFKAKENWQVLVDKKGINEGARLGKGQNG